MRKLFLSLLTVGLCLAIQAQQRDTRKEIHDNILLSGSNYVAYVDPTEALTPAPKGYEPFYLTHYGRHGSRWLCSDWEYSDVMAAIERAHEANKLTAKGEELRGLLNTFYTTAVKRAGELTTVGEQQHHRIGKRLTERFPEIFSAKDCRVDARSTVVIRCILSMEAECEELMAYNPQINMHNDVSESFQYYLNADWDKQLNNANTQRWKKVTFDYNKEYANPERFWNSIINDPDYRDTKLTSRTTIMKRIFDICTNMQSHYGSKSYPVSQLDRQRQNLPASLNSYSLFKFFTEDEVYNLWRCKNIEWYVGYASGVAPFCQRFLLKNFIETADSIAQPTLVEQQDGSYKQTFQTHGFHGATMRFGHETCVMPMSALLELGNCYPKVPLENVDTLERAWRNYDIFPMGSNIQLIFYRPKKGDGDILVKALLNEREVTLPAKTDQYPYYRWADLREYYEQKLLQYEEE